MDTGSTEPSTGSNVILYDVTTELLRVTPDVGNAMPAVSVSGVHIAYNVHAEVVV